MGALKKVAGKAPTKPFKGSVELSWFERRVACTIGCLPTFRARTASDRSPAPPSFSRATRDPRTGCLIYVILWAMFVVCMQIHFSNRNWIRDPTKSYGDDKDEFADED